MKQRPGKHPDQATDIILCDKEMENLVQQLVKKAHDSEICVSHLTKAIATVWRETFYIEPEKLNSSEQTFSKKVKNFLKYYETDLMREFNYGKEYKIDFTDAKRKEKFFIEMYELLCSMYGVFEKEETVNQKLILTFAKIHGFKSTFYDLREDINFLQIFLYYRLSFSKNDLTIPFYQSPSSSENLHLSSVKKFVDFKKQYILATHSTCQTAVAAIWVINTFF